MTEMQTDIHHLAVTIGARPPLSKESDEAAQYVSERLRQLGIETWSETFYSPASTWQQLQPQLALTLTGLAISTRGKAWVRQLGLPLIGLAAWGGKQTLDGQAAWWELIVPQQRTENVIGRIPANQEMRQRVILIAHLDTDRIRFSSQPILRQWIAEPFRMLQRLTIWGATLPISKTWIMLRRLLRSATIGTSLLMALDDQSDYGDGANDNASGVAVLLSLAEQLAANPLPHTEVILAFTNSDTVSGRGTAELATAHVEDWRDAYWMVLDSVGAGEICWVKDGLPNQPDNGMVKHLQAAAQAHRTDGVMGRSLNVLNPARPLFAHHLNAVAIMGYERADDVPVGWHLADDAPSIIDEETLHKTRRLINSVLQSIDQQVVEKAAI